MRQTTRNAAFALSLALGFASVTPSADAIPLPSAAMSVTMTPQLVHKLDYHSNIQVSPDGRLVATLHRGSIYVWDVETGTILRTLAPAGTPNFVFANDGKTIHYVTLSTVNGKSSLLSGEWNLVTGEASQKVGPVGIFVAAVVPGGKRAILGENPSGTVHVYDIENNKILRSFGSPPPAGTPPNQLDPRTISTMSAPNSGDVVLFERVNGNCEMWDVTRGQLRYQAKRKSMTNRLVIAANGSRSIYTHSGDASDSGKLEVVDVATGKLIHTISTGKDWVEGLAISADGRTAITSTRAMFRIWSLDTGNEMGSGALWADNMTTALSFLSDKQFIHGAAGRLDVWDTTRKEKIRSLFSDKPSLVSISSAVLTPTLDRAITVGNDASASRFASWDLMRLGLRPALPTPNVTMKLATNASRAWAPGANGFYILDLQTFQQRNIMRDTGTSIGNNFVVSGNGQKLIVGGQRRGSDPITNQTWGEIVLSEWDAESGSKIDKIVRKQTNIAQTALATSHDGRFVVTNDYDTSSRRTNIRLWDLQRDSLVLAFDMTKASHVAAALSGNGQTLALAFMEHAKPGSHKVQIIDVPSGKVRSSMTSSVLGLVQSMVFSPNADKLALGSATVEVFHTATGNLAHTFRGDPQWVTSLAFSADGNYLLIAGQGGTTKLYRLDKPASTTMLASGDEWLVYDDDGYFDASRKGGSLVAAVDGVRAYKIDQLAVRNNRPDLLLERMGLGTPEIIAHFRSRYQRRLEKLGITDESSLPTFQTTPDVTIDNIDVEGNVAVVKFDAVARGAELLRYNVFVNDVPLFGTLGKTMSGKTLHGEERIELGSGRNKIEVSAMDARGGESLRAVRVVERKQIVNGNLYYLAFGVSKYKNSKYNLGYPHKDVTDLGDVLRAGVGQTFTQVHVRTYVNEMATVENVRKAKDFLKDATVDDTVVLFIAGHGLHAANAAADYYFATHEVDPKRLEETAARFEVVEDLLTGIRPRKKLFLMDTCESGERENDEAPSAGIPTTARALVARSARPLELDVLQANAPQGTSVLKQKYFDRDRYIYNDLTRRTGAIVVSSSRGSEFSYEMEEIANGVFTEEILRALTSKDADRNGDGLVSTDELRGHLEQVVPKRTNNQQHPTVDRDNLDVSFAFPVVAAAADIVDRIHLPILESSSLEGAVSPHQTPLRVASPHACGCEVAGRNDWAPSVLYGLVVAAVAGSRRARRRH